MRKNIEPIARGAFWIMATVVLSQLATLVLRKNPAGPLTLPEAFVALGDPSAKVSATHSNLPPSSSTGTHASVKLVPGTNTPRLEAPNSNSTGIHALNAKATGLTVSNTTPTARPQSTAMGMPPGMPPGMPARMSPGGGSMGPAKPLPPAAQAWIDKIKETEVFGPVPRPMPMALLGIAGEDVFFRAPNGQTGVFRKGEEMGGVKLLQTGPNRILVEQDGQKKELTIFSGIGSESLLPSEKTPVQ